MPGGLAIRTTACQMGCFLTEINPGPWCVGYTFDSTFAMMILPNARPVGHLLAACTDD